MEYLANMLLSVIFLSCLLLPYAQGLQCYVCNTVNEDEKDCDSIPVASTKYLKNCTEGTHKSCRIQTQWVDFTVLNQTHGKRTIRQCASDKYDSDKPCYYRAGFGGKVNVCLCPDDGCNEASSSVSSLVAIILSLILTVRVLQ